MPKVRGKIKEFYFIGRFNGQSGYGYKSFESFVDAINRINKGLARPGSSK